MADDNKITQDTVDALIGTIKQMGEMMSKTFSVDDSSGISTNHPYQVGKPYLIRTVTFTHLGTIKAVYKHEIVMESGAVWVADTGRFNSTLRKGSKEIKEYEGFEGEPIIGREAVVDAVLWRHDLPSQCQYPK